MRIFGVVTYVVNDMSIDEFDDNPCIYRKSKAILPPVVLNSIVKKSTYCISDLMIKSLPSKVLCISVSYQLDERYRDYMKASYISYYDGLDEKGKVVFQGNGSHIVNSETEEPSPHEMLAAINQYLIKSAKAHNPAIARIVIKGLFKL